MGRQEEVAQRRWHASASAEYLQVREKGRRNGVLSQHCNVSYTNSVKAGTVSNAKLEEDTSSRQGCSAMTRSVESSS